VHNTTSQYNLPEIGKKIAYKANRKGVAACFPDLAVQKTIEVDLALLTYDDTLLSALELSILLPAKQHDAPTLSLLQTVPGIGTILSLVLRDEIHDMARFPRGQDFASSCRRVKGAQASAGKRLGTSGKKIGKAHLQWACSEAAALCLRNNPAGQHYLARLENTYDKGQALTILAHTLAQTVSDRLKRHTACERDLFLHGEGSRAGAPGASRATQGMSRHQACSPSWCTASVHAKVRLGCGAPSPRLCLDTCSGSCTSGESRTLGTCAAPPPSLTLTGKQ